ncbi:MAG TPA: phosphate-starvation-inducible PsiE family protein [Steroidobacteraceae bacterium]
MAMIGAVAVVAIVWTGIKIAGDMLLGEAFLDRAALQDTVGLILVILILLEFNHSILVAMVERSGAVQVRMLVRITILVVTRKLMLMDFTAMTAQTLFGFGGLLLALGGLYWLICDGDRRRGPATDSAANSG